MRVSTILATLVSLGVLLAGCASGGDHPASTGSRTQSPTSVATTSTPASPAASPSCSAPAGGRCPGPVSLEGATIQVAPDSRTLTYVSLCGGSLSATRTAGRVTLTFTASAVRAGGMMCARVPVSTVLDAPLGKTPVYDSVSGVRLTVADEAMIPRN